LKTKEEIVPKVTVWKCPRTKKLFEKKSAYIKHLKGMARINLNQRYENRRYRDFFNSVNTLVTNATTIDEIIDWVMDNWLELSYRCWCMERNARYKKQEFDKLRIPKLLDLKMDISETSDIRRGFELKSAEKVPGFCGKIKMNLSIIKGGYDFSMDIFRVMQKISVNYGNGGKNTEIGITMKKSDWINLKGNNG
jgi:hypothetical protein